MPPYQVRGRPFRMVDEMVSDLTAGVLSPMMVHRLLSGVAQSAIDDEQNLYLLEVTDIVLQQIVPTSKPLKVAIVLLSVTFNAGNFGSPTVRSRLRRQRLSYPSSDETITAIFIV